MSEEELELLITLDDPEDPEKEDNFHHNKSDSIARPQGQLQEGGDPTRKLE